MAKQEPQDVERDYFFPSLGVTVKAKTPEQAQKLAEKAANEDKEQ